MAKLKKLGLIIASCLMMLAVCLGLTACGDKVGKVDSIVYDGTKITWAEAKNAESYIVTINDRPFVTTATSYPYRAKSSEMEITVSICGVGAKDKEGKEVSRTFMRLDTMERTEITFDEEGVMSWSNVDGADSYLLSINGEVETVDGTTYEDFPVGKALTIKVKPNRTDGLGFSDWSSSFNKTYLAAPVLEKIKYDGAQLSWNGVMSAQSYEVYIDGQLFSEQNGTKLEYDAKQESFEVEIKAKNSSDDIYDSVMTDVKEFIFLPVIETLEVSDGKLRWDPVAQAESYDVKIGSAAAFNTKDLSIALETGKTLSVKVKPVTSGEVYFSDWSNTKSVHILATPALKWEVNMTLENGEEGRPISWNAITAAEGYEVQIEEPDGGVDSFAADGLNFLYAFNQTGGKYTVRVRATTTSEDVYSSAYSAPIVVERLAAPTLRAQNPITSNPKSNKSFDVVWNSVLNASGYQFYLNNNPVKDIEIVGYKATVYNPISEEETSAIQLQYMIQSRGAGVEITGNGAQSVTLSSVMPREGMTAEVCTFTISSMAMPTNLDCSGQYMTWSGVAQQYSVEGTLAAEPVTAHSAQYDLYKLSAGLKRLSVSAQGDGKQVLASNFTPTINVERLGKPENIHVLNSNLPDPQIYWDEVKNATGYYMRLNDSEESNNVNVGDSIASSYIKESGLRLSLTAYCNDWKDNTYYVTSEESAGKTFFKVETPTFNKQIVRNDDELVWNAPGNVSAVSEAFTYTIYKNEEVWKRNLTSPSIKLSELTVETGKEMVITVKCIGDSTCISSDISAAVNLLILDAPELQRESGAAKYTWEPLTNSDRNPTAYEILVDGVIVKNVPFSSTSTTDYFYVPTTFVEVNKWYNVQIRAIGNGGFTDSGVAIVSSSFKNLAQYTERLKQPTIDVSYKVDGAEAKQYDQNGKLEVSILTAVPNAKAYEFVIGGAGSGEIADLSWSKMPDSTGESTVTARAIGGMFDENGTYYITSQDATEKQVILHGAVQGLDKEESTHIVWELEDPRPKYAYTLTVYYTDGKTETWGYGSEYDEDHKLTARDSSINLGIDKMKKVDKVEIYKNYAKYDNVLEIGSETVSKTFTQY